MRIAFVKPIMNKCGTGRRNKGDIQRNIYESPSNNHTNLWRSSHVKSSPNSATF